MKKVIQFGITNLGTIYLLYEDGSMVECEMEHLEQDQASEIGNLRLKIVNEIKMP